MAEVYRPSLDDPNAWVPYRYHPSRIAAIVFAVLFAITTAFHIFQLIRRRTWYFIPLVVGGLCKLYTHKALADKLTDKIIANSRSRGIHRPYLIN